MTAARPKPTPAPAPPAPASYRAAAAAHGGAVTRLTEDLRAALEDTREDYRRIAATLTPGPGDGHTAGCLHRVHAAATDATAALAALAATAAALTQTAT